jgi:hypothetical protein
MSAINETQIMDNECNQVIESNSDDESDSEDYEFDIYDICTCPGSIYEDAPKIYGQCKRHGIK